MKLHTTNIRRHAERKNHNSYRYFLSYIPLNFLKGKDHKNTFEFCLKVFAKLNILKQTAWKLDIYFRRYCNFMFSKWLPMEAATILKLT